MPSAIASTVRRRLQLVAGSTYAISLPKPWVEKNKLVKNQELLISGRGDGSLIISPHSTVPNVSLADFHVNVDEYGEGITTVLFSIYYLGAESLHIFSKAGLKQSDRSRVKAALRHMSGAEIVFEDANRIDIKVFLDTSKVDIGQLYYRVALLIGSSIDTITEGLNIDEISRNEDEVDRLYHLLTKIIVLSQLNFETLASSNIKNVYYLSPYFMISKKLENISDKIYVLSIYLSKSNKVKIKDVAPALAFLKEKLTAAALFLMNLDNQSFAKTDAAKVKAVEEQISCLKDMDVMKALGDALRFLVDVEEEMSSVSFYTRLIKQK